MRLNPSQLETIRFACIGWVNILNDNMKRLNDSLLKISTMQDVNMVGLADKDILWWDTATSKYVNVPSGFLTTTTTT